MVLPTPQSPSCQPAGLERLVLPWALLFVFFNNALLPHGLLYSTFVSPFFVYWLYRDKRSSPFVLLIVLLALPIPFHLAQGVVARYYGTSLLLLMSVGALFFTVLETARRLGSRLDFILQRLLALNTLLVIVALLVLPSREMRVWFWNLLPFSPGIAPFPRLDLLAYEPSHYGLLMAPTFIYFILRLCTGNVRAKLLITLAVLIPLLLTLSFGIIASIVIAVGLTTVRHWRVMPKFFHRLIFYGGAGVVLATLALGAVWPRNPAFERVRRITDGYDTSAKGRTSDAFMFADRLLKESNPIFGIGPGQIKVRAHRMIIEHYQYRGKWTELVRIPNSTAEVMASFGYYGLLLKLFIPLFFFLRWKLHTNVFNKSLFIFIFLYQFTGSFMTNAAEAICWALALGARLPEFDVATLSTAAKGEQVPPYRGEDRPRISHSSSPPVASDGAHS